MVAFLRAHKLEVGIFAFALAVRLVLIALYVIHGQGSLNWGADGGDYVNEAQNLLTGHGFSRSWGPPYLPDAIRTPLYPLFLAGVKSVFGSFTAVIFIEALISSFLPVLFIRTAILFVRDRRVLIAGAFFLCVEPHLVFNSIFFASEGISIILLWWSLFELLKMVYAKAPREASVRAGFALGLATLARPITFYLPLVLAPLFVYQGHLARNMRDVLKWFTLFLAIFLVVISPWLIRNYSTFGSASMATVGWFNVYTRLAATVVAIDTGDDFYTSYHKLLDDLSVRGYIKHPPPVTEFEIQDPRFGSVLKQESLRILSEHKKGLAIYIATYSISILTQDNTLGYLGYFGLTDVKRPPFAPTLYLAQHGPIATIKAVAPYLMSFYIVPYLMRALFLILFLGALWGAYLLFRAKKQFGALLLLGFIGYVGILSINAGSQIDGRYRVQFLLAETVLASVALEQYLARRRS